MGLFEPGTWKTFEDVVDEMGYLGWPAFAMVMLREEETRAAGAMNLALIAASFYAINGWRYPEGWLPLLGSYAAGSVITVQVLKSQSDKFIKWGDQEAKRYI